MTDQVEQPYEERVYTATYGRSEMGRSRVYLDCPFCGEVVEAFLWSLAGVGKLCPCGAKFGSTGMARRKT